MRRVTWVCGLILAGVVALRFRMDTRWVGDWTETGWTLIGSGAMGATLAGLLLAILASRDLAPLRSAGVRPSRARFLLYVVRVHWQPMLISWCLVVAVAYAVTAAAAPSPSVASPWPAISASAIVLCVMSVCTACGCLLRPAFAVPTSFLLCYVVPVSIAWVDVTHEANGFTPYSSLHLGLPFTVNASHYALKTAFFSTVALTIIMSVLSHLTRRPVGLVVLVGAALVLAVAIPLRLDNDQILEQAAPIERMRCEDVSADEGTWTVCVLTEHERFQAETLTAVKDVSESIPPSTMPRAYLEEGLAIPSGLSAPEVATVSTEMIRLGPYDAILLATANWNVCTRGEAGFDLAFARENWLLHRLGRLDQELTEGTLGKTFFEDHDEAAQLQWWRDPIGVPCSP